MITNIQIFKESINHNNDDIIDLKSYDFTQLFNLVNKECFNNSLTIIPFKLTNSKSYTASFNATINRVTRELIKKHFNFSTVFKITYGKLKNIMAHEMIHYYLAATGDRDRSPHGYSFYREMKRINGLGLGYNVTEKDDEPGELSDHVLAKKQPEKIFITFQKGTKRGYGLVPETIYNLNKEQLLRDIKYFKFTDVNVYKTTSPHTKPLRGSNGRIGLYTVPQNVEYLLDNIFNDAENTKFLYEL